MEVNAQRQKSLHLGWANTQYALLRDKTIYTRQSEIHFEFLRKHGGVPPDEKTLPIYMKGEGKESRLKNLI